MSTGFDHDFSQYDLTENETPPLLDPGSYTAHRLYHATPEHLHLTSRRVFVGPVPKGWLQSHRKSWYSGRISGYYSKKESAFIADATVSRRRRLTTLGMDGAHPSYQHDTDRTDTGLGGAETTTTVADGGANGIYGNVDGMESEDSDGPVSHENVSTGLDIPKIRSMPAARSPQPPRGESFATARETPSTFEAESEQSGYILPPAVRTESPQPAGFEDTESEASRQGTSSTTGTYEEAEPASAPAGPSTTGINKFLKRPVNPVRSQSQEAANSLSSLLEHDNNNRRRKKAIIKSEPVLPTSSRPSVSIAKPTKSALRNGSAAGPSNSAEAPAAVHTKKRKDKVNTGLVRFKTQDDAVNKDQEMQRRLAHLTHGKMPNSFGKRFSFKKSREGQIVKLEKMLVRVEVCGAELPEEYDENESGKVETRTVEKWREYVVVCRETGNEDIPMALKLYKSRVIPAIEKTRISQHSTREIPLHHRTTHVNLYSSLDKTLVIWLPHKKDGHIIYIMRPRSAAISVEWYSFLRKALGWERPDNVLIHVPDLSASIRIASPFDKTERAILEGHAERANAEGLRTGQKADPAITECVPFNPILEEGAVANHLMQSVLTILGGSSEWEDVLKHWKANERVGLAWRKYDRLEWVHGINEKKMYGALGMAKTHDLELRPKLHYPTSVDLPSSDEDPTSMTEPPPVEGFLIRLTSGRGRDQRLGRLFYKRLYFYTHDNLLCFCKPALALPPPPPLLPPRKGTRLPASSEIIDAVPIIYAVTPFTLQNGDIEWVKNGNAAFQERKDEDAYTEAERKVNSLLRMEGFIDLAKIDKACKAVNAELETDIERGNDVDFHQSVPNANTIHEDGTVSTLDDERTFEIQLTNGLTLKLQSYDKATRDEWILRLTDLAQYWRARKCADLALLKQTRQRNLDLLHIDEEMESYVGQYAKKWEVSQSIASSLIWNVCGISSCRTITMAGVLYRKTSKHATFKRYYVIACHGKILIFHNNLRTRSGAETPHIHHAKRQELLLDDAYVYSGIVTENELLYQNQTFDSNNPGRHPLPRVYEDGWMSSDEDAMTCFVLWHGVRKTLVKSANGEERKRGRVKRVTKLGQQGKSMVFKARSRQERDIWVMAIGIEIERLHTPDEIRVRA